MNLTAFFALAAGAVCGAGFRHALGVWLNPVFPRIPLGTLSANLLGSFLMGLALVLIVQRGGVAPEWRLAIITGFFGSLTTLSTFSAETFTLLARGDLAGGLGAIALHVGGALAMVTLGVVIANRLVGG